MVKRVLVSADQMRSLLGRTKNEVTAVVVGALYQAGIDTSDPKKIRFCRQPDDSCLFEGPVRE